MEPIATRRLAYALLIVIAAGSLAGRILSIERVFEPSVSRPATVDNGWRLEWPSELPPPSPTFSSNDRSRWATVRALVDEGHYWIGERDEAASESLMVVGVSTVGLIDSIGGLGPLLASSALLPDRFRKDRGFVFDEYDWRTIDKVLDPKTERHFYSSKPPLLPTMMAGQYWVLQKLFGWKISEQKWPVVMAGLFTFQWLPLVVYFILLERLADRYGTTDWGRLFIVAAGCFATMPTLFAITFNNHTIAACSALFALYAALGASGAEAPARGRPLNMALAGLFAGFTACCELPATGLAAALFLLLLVRMPRLTVLVFVPAALLPVAAYFVTNYLAIGQWLPVQSDINSAWYQFEGSPWKWTPSKLNSNIDSLREPKAVYAFHLLFGHHGLFSLAPIWLLAVGGMLMGVTYLARRGPMHMIRGREGRDDWAVIGALALALTVVVVGFYVYETNNYGGWTNGPRWLMWLTPLWLLALLPAVDRMATRRWTRVVGYVLLGFSVLSVSYRDWNPWRHPWVYNFLESQGWRPY